MTTLPEKLKELDGEEFKIPMPWGHISGKWWGPKDQQPIVFLHAWQDNLGTFDKLVPYFYHEHSILCIDLPGHGFSSHFSAGKYYYEFWDGVMVLRRIVNYYRWKKVKLLGHSLGGIISFLYAAIYPDQVEFLIKIDVAGPSFKPIRTVVNGMHKRIDMFLKVEQDSSLQSYEYDQMVEIIDERFDRSMTRESIEIWLKRGSKPASNGKFYFTMDERVKIGFIEMLTIEQSVTLGSKIVAPYLNIRAVPGMFPENEEEYKKILEAVKRSSKNFQFHTVEGTHHVHLNNPERIAPIIKNFLSDK